MEDEASGSNSNNAENVPNREEEEEQEENQENEYDVLLIAGFDGTRIPAKRERLSEFSQYFQVFFTNDSAESPMQEITIPLVSGDILEKLVEFTHTGQLELQIQTVMQLLTTSVLLGMTEIVGCCSDFLCQCLYFKNCLGISKLAEKCHCFKLLQIADAFTLEHFVQVAQTIEFLELDFEHLSKLISNEELRTPSEEFVFYIALTWIQHDPEEREVYLPLVLAQLWLPYLRPSTVVDHLKPICQRHDCLYLCQEAIRRQNLTPRRWSNATILLIGGIWNTAKPPLTEENVVNSIHQYDPRLNRWIEWKNMLHNRRDFAIALMHDELFIIGGRIMNQHLNTVESLNLRTLEWTRQSDMNEIRWGLSAAVLKSFVYAIGGFDGKQRLNTVERWSPFTEQWSYVASMKSKRSAASTVKFAGQLFVIGGWDGFNYFNSVESYSPHMDDWIPRAPMNYARYCPAAAAGSCYLYVMGGIIDNYSKTDTVERYDPLTDVWVQICSFSSPRWCMSSVSLDDRLIAIGGGTGFDYSNVVEEYNSETNSWKKLKPLKKGIGFAKAIVIPDLTNTLIEDIIRKISRIKMN